MADTDSNPSEIPQHVAIIMDGNNRWARARNLKGIAGHQAGADRLEDVMRGCLERDIRVLTVFAFSSENWARSKQEVKALMSLFASTLKRYSTVLKQEDVALRVIGRRDRFSPHLQKLIDEVEQETACGTYTLVVAADYGGRWDIAQACQAIAAMAYARELRVDAVDEELLSSYCALADLPPVDLLIRTGAEYRISNFLLWQISYSELYFANCYWPDFDGAWLRKALKDYARRQRRFGTDLTVPGSQYDSTSEC